MFVQHLVQIFAEVKRVLKPDGCLFVNLGDSYSGSGKGPTGHNGIGDQEQRQGFTGNPERFKTSTLGGGQSTNLHQNGKQPSAPGTKAKSLVLIPERFALAMADDGWYVRSRIAWCKRAPMPESVRDRPTNAWEHIWMFTRSSRYFWDADAVREEGKDWSNGGPGTGILTTEHYGAGNGGNAGLGSLAERYKRGAVAAGRNMWNYWLLSPDPEPLAHFACVDDATEAMTPDGWKHQAELNDGDLIAAYDPESHTWKWEPATFHRYPYQGEMVAIEKRDSSQRLTPNHRCLTRDRYGKESVIEAGDLTPSAHVPTAAAFGGIDDEGIGLSWAGLVGWFIAEGNIEKRYRDVCIYQSLSANPAKCERIRQLLTDVGATWTESTREREWRGRPSVEVTFRIGREFGNKLKALAPAKAMTPELAALPLVEAAALLEALIDGDGNRRCDGRTCIVQKDRASLDLMQVLALRLGYRAQIGPHGDGFTLYLTRGEWLTLRGTNGKHTPVAREHYEGVVWCPNVLTGFWFARRDGKPFITGNTFPREIPRRCIAAATSERGECPQCGKSWVRVTEHTVNATGSGRKHISGGTQPGANGWEGVPRATIATTTKGWAPQCDHGLPPIPSTVLDPFVGSGTSTMVARSMFRRSIGIDLSEDYMRTIAVRKNAQMAMMPEREVS